MGILKSVIKKTEAKASIFRYHQISNNIASATLKEIEKEKGKLSTNTKKIVRDYANEVLGWKGYAPWLYVYTHIAGEFKEGWIPDNYYGKVVIPKIQGDYGKVSFLKPLTNHLFAKEIGPDIAYFINGFWFGKNFQPISRKTLNDTFFVGTNKVIFKLDQSYQGRGIFVYEKNGFDLNSIEQKGNGVVQKFIQQHSFFDSFVASAVATIRITTVVDPDNAISLRACYLRLGRTKDTHVKSNNHVRIPIDMTTGILHEKGYLANWKTIDSHPDSNISFSNKEIPNYEGCVDLVLQLHQKMPMVRAIGWDMIVDKEYNPIVMEWNGYSNDIKFSEATQGPCFKGLGWDKLH